MTREEWLCKMVLHFRQHFRQSEYTIPDNIRVSCGLPSRRAFGAKTRTIGQCWSSIFSTDGVFEIYISPTIDESSLVGATLAHELVHAVVGPHEGHGKPFRECATAIGLVGKMTETKAGDELLDFINDKVIDLGEYPHAKLNYELRKRDGTRMKKIVCKNPNCKFMMLEGRPYSVRMTRKAMEYGTPFCGCCKSTMEQG